MCNVLHTMESCLEVTSFTSTRSYVKHPTALSDRLMNENMAAQWSRPTVRHTDESETHENFKCGIIGVRKYTERCLSWRGALNAQRLLKEHMRRYDHV